jgi:hypothetical protein
MIRRRDFITLLGGAAAWPLAARAQQGDRVRRIGVLMSGDENNPVSKADVSAFTQALADLGWADGSNMRMDVRWAGDDINRMRALAQELVSLQPDIILTGATPDRPPAGDATIKGARGALHVKGVRGESRMARWMTATAVRTTPAIASSPNGKEYSRE